MVAVLLHDTWLFGSDSMDCPSPDLEVLQRENAKKNLFAPVLNMMSATWTVSELRFGEQSKRSDEQRAHIPSNFGHLITHAIWKGFYSDLCRKKTLLRLRQARVELCSNSLIRES